MALHIPTRSDICAYVYTSKTITSVRRTCPRGNVALNGEGKEKSRRARALVGRRKIIAFYVWVRRQAWAADKFGRMEGEKE